MQDSILIEARRRCSICFGLYRDFAIKPGQLAHLDHNPANAAPANLVFLCLSHHNEYDSRTSQSKNYTQGEVRRYRAELFDEISRIFDQDTKGQEFEVKMLSENVALLTSEEAAATPVATEHPGRWKLRYTFEFASPARVGEFRDDWQIMIADEMHCHWIFRDGVEGVGKFELPQDLVEEWERNDANGIAALVGDGKHEKVYGRPDGVLSIATEVLGADEPREVSWDTLKAHRTCPCFGGFAPDGSIFMSGDEAGELLIWDWPARRQIRRLSSLVGPVSSANLNYSIDRAIVTGRNGTFEIFELSTGRALGSGKANIYGDNAQVHHSLNPDYLVAHDGADRFEALETTSLNPVSPDLWPRIFVNIKFSADKRALAVWTVTGALLVGVRDTEEPIGTDALEMVSPPDRRVSEYQVSADGERIAFLIERRSLQVWERVRAG